MRYLSDFIDSFSSQKILIMSGPRQVGKTSLLKAFLEEKQGVYLNYDILADRDFILDHNNWKNLDWIVKNPIVGLDELHKYARWKNLLKNIYDKKIKNNQLIVTGSAKLDFFRKSGDSLFGRYEHLRLHPITVGERLRDFQKPEVKALNFLALDFNLYDSKLCQTIFDQLYHFTGFPEVFFAKDPLLLNRWSRQRTELLIKEDLRDLSLIQELSLVEHLAKLIPSKVASIFSHQSIVNTLQVNHGSVVKWVKCLEALYYIFKVPVYSKKINKTLSKASKIYLWDYSCLEDEGQRFENMIALHLLKTVQFLTDLGYGDYDLFYVRDRDGNEVDFLITKNNQPLVTIEAKISPEWPKALKKHSESLNVQQAIIIVKEENIDIKKNSVRMISASKFLANLV